MEDHGSIWRGERVRLRRITASDWEPFFEDQADTEAARFAWRIKPPRSPEATRRWVEQEALRESEGDEQRFAIESLEGELVGSLNTIRCDRRNGTFGYGLGVFRKQRRKGYASDAIRLLLRYFFDELAYQKVNVSVYEFNEPSLRLHRELGFTEEGRIRRAIRSGGRYHDEIQLGLTDDEFRASAVRRAQ